MWSFASGFSFPLPVMKREDSCGLVMSVRKKRLAMKLETGFLRLQIDKDGFLQIVV